jgi:hypothetical protein
MPARLMRAVFTMLNRSRTNSANLKHRGVSALLPDIRQVGAELPSMPCQTNRRLIGL